jgi:hypothetical protein
MPGGERVLPSHDTSDIADGFGHQLTNVLGDWSTSFLSDSFFIASDVFQVP